MANQIHVETDCNEAGLARLASEGWQLISVTHWCDQRRDDYGTYDQHYDVAYLQRAASESQPGERVKGETK